MLFTASVSNLIQIKRKMKIYYIIANHGNDEVAPDQIDLKYYKNGLILWEGFKINYLAKIYKPKASEWMKRVSAEAAHNDVVLVDEEKDVNQSCRKILAELMINMFTGEFNFKYLGEVTT